MPQSGVRHFSKMNTRLHVWQLLTIRASTSAGICAYKVQNPYSLPRKVTPESEEKGWAFSVSFASLERFISTQSLFTVLFNTSLHFLRRLQGSWRCHWVDVGVGMVGTGVTASSAAGSLSKLNKFLFFIRLSSRWNLSGTLFEITFGVFRRGCSGFLLSE